MKNRDLNSGRNKNKQLFRFLEVKLIWLILFGMMAFTPSFSQQKFRLNEGWEFVKGDLGSAWEAARPAVLGSPEALPVWEKVTLPHSWNATDAVDPDLNYYQGPGWYRTQLKISNPYPGGRTLLHFEGAGQKTSVYVYTTKVVSHVGGYDEFTVDITEAVGEFMKTETFKKVYGGKVPVSIRCDNTRDVEMIPSDLSDFNLYGGIYRYLNLEYVPALSIQQLFANAVDGGSGKNAIVSVSATWLNPEKVGSAQIEVTILNPKGEHIARVSKTVNPTSGEQFLEKFELKNPIQWSPSNPNLYSCSVALKSEKGEQLVQEKFGVRSYEFAEHGPFFLNSERLLLRGTHRHEDHAGVGPAMTEGMIRQEMVMMKDMGVNFIRLGHYQQSRIVLDLCDSLGILVWEEIPWCRGGLGGESYKEQARRMLTNMIEQHRNHPAVIIWGLSNEIDWSNAFPTLDKEGIRTFMKELNDLSHRLDPTRQTAIRRCDFCKDIVDVYSPSIWAGWYRGRYTDYKAESEKEMKGVKHFLHVEWGGDSHALRHSEDPDRVVQAVDGGKGADERTGDASLHGGIARASKDGDWSETYICNLIDWHLKEQETMPWLSGTAYWPFKDFSTPIRPENPVPFMNQKGVVERDFTPKESFYVFQSYWTEKPMAHIYGHTWPVRWGNEGETKMVKVYSNCPEAELFLNGKSMGLKKRNSQDFPTAGLRWNVIFAKGENHLKIVARKGRDVVTDEISFQYQTEKWGAPAKMVFEKIALQGNTITLQVKFLDKNGVQCLDAINYAEFVFVGDGKLLDNLGTSSGSRKVQAYNGRAIIRAVLTGKQAVAGVKSEGLETVMIKL